MAKKIKYHKLRVEADAGQSRPATTARRLKAAVQEWLRWPVFRMLVGLSVWFCSSVALTAYNKWLVYYHEFHFPVLLISSSSVFIFAVLLPVVLFLAPGMRDHPSWWTRLSWRQILLFIVPAGVLFGIDIASTNASYEYISIALCEVVKSAVPVIILVARFTLRIEQLSWPKFSVILLTCIGVAMTTAGEGEVAAAGLVLAVVATLAASSRLLVAEFMLQGEDKIHPVLALLYTSPVIALASIIPYMALEATPFSVYASDKSGGKILLLLLGEAMLALCLNVGAFLSISATSALTLCIVGVAKMVAVVAFSILWFGHEVSTINDIGLVSSVVGVALYNYLRATQLKEEGVIDRPTERSDWDTRADVDQYKHEFEDIELDLESVHDDDAFSQELSLEADAILEELNLDDFMHGQDQDREMFNSTRLHSRTSQHQQL